MSDHVLLNFLNNLRKRDKMGSLSCIRYYLSYDIKTILKSHFRRENVRVLPYA